MKKFIFLIFFLFPLATFAWVDTDRVCADDTKQWKINDIVNISYPTTSIRLLQLWKDYYTLERDNTYNPKGSDRLYYIVNLATKSEVYTYDCKDKKPKLLLSLPINKDHEEYYAIDYINDGNLLIAWKTSGASEWDTQTIIVYNVYTNKRVVTIKNTKRMFGEGSVDGFVSGKWAWYLYFSSTDFDGIGSLYRIDKKTQKITKL